MPRETGHPGRAREGAREGEKVEKVVEASERASGSPFCSRRESRPLRRRRVAVGRWYSFLRDSPDARTRAVARPRAPSPVPPKSRLQRRELEYRASFLRGLFRNQCGEHGFATRDEPHFVLRGNRLQVLSIIYKI